MGRPSKYDPDKTPDLAYKLSLLGLTDKEMCDIMEIAESTFNEWKLKFEDFSESLKKGKHDADGEVVKSLYKRANGYDYEEIREEREGGTMVKVVKTKKHMPPDVGAAAFWLKNRQRERWNEKGHESTKLDDKPVLENGTELPKDE